MLYDSSLLREEKDNLVSDRIAVQLYVFDSQTDESDELNGDQKF